MSKPSIAIYFPELTGIASSSIGGLAFRILHAIELLSPSCNITLIVDSKPDWAHLNSMYGTALDEASVSFLHPKRFIGIRDDSVFLLPGCGRRFDLCISGHNIVDYRVPALHFVADCRFDFELARQSGATVDPSYESDYGRELRVSKRIRNSLKSILKHVLGAVYGGLPRTIRSVIQTPGERIICNSHWMAGLMADCYGIPKPDVLYPPVVSEFRYVPWGERKSGFLTIGRISPEKKIERIIEIVRGVRGAGFPSEELHIAGALPSTPYGRKIRELIESESWITSHGDVSGESKHDLLCSHRYALHACEIEAFGISVAEYMKAGLIPFIPNKGGAREVVSNPSLEFGSTEEAIDRITGLLKNEAHQIQLHESLSERGRMFTLKSFKQGFESIVHEELARRNVGR